MITAHEFRRRLENTARELRHRVRLARESRGWMVPFLGTVLALSVIWIFYALVAGGPPRLRADTPDDRLAGEVLAQVRLDRRFSNVEVRRSLTGAGLEVIGEVPTAAAETDLRAVVGAAVGQAPVRYEVYPQR